MNILELSVREPSTLCVGGAEYKVDFPLAQVVELEKALGRPMKHPANWFQIETHEVRAILTAGLRQHNPEDADKLAETICSSLQAEDIDTVIDFICGTACPEATRRIKEMAAKASKRAAKGLEPLPNVPSADTVQ